jgi:hypothetical protein
MKHIQLQQLQFQGKALAQDIQFSLQNQDLNSIPNSLLSWADSQVDMTQWTDILESKIRQVQFLQLDILDKAQQGQDELAEIMLRWDVDTMQEKLRNIASSKVDTAALQKTWSVEYEKLQAFLAAKTAA